MSQLLSTLSIQLSNVLKCDFSGNGSANIDFYSLSLPKLNIKNFPSTIADLVNLVGSGNITYSYYVQANGRISHSTCANPILLMGQLIFSDSTNVVQNISSTTNSFQLLKQWYLMTNNSPNTISGIKTYQKCDNPPDCSCDFNGWGDVSLTLKIIINVNWIQYCLLDYNAGNYVCFSYLLDYVKKNEMAPEIKNKLEQYCKSKFSTQTLDMWNDPLNMDPTDYLLCACYMGNDEYQKFADSLKIKYPNMNLQGISPKCLFPACSVSPFKPTDPEQCQNLPSCLDNVKTSNGLVTDAVLNPSVNCDKFGLQPTSHTGSMSRSSSNSFTRPDPSNPPTPSILSTPRTYKYTVKQESFFDKYKWWIIGSIIAIIFLIIIIIILVALRMHYSKTKKSVTYNEDLYSDMYTDLYSDL